MCTVLLPPGGNPIAVNKYIYIYIYIYHNDYHNFVTLFFFLSTAHQIARDCKGVPVNFNASL